MPWLLCVLLQVRDAGNLLTRAGLAMPTVDLDTFVMHYSSAVGLINHLRLMAEGNALAFKVIQCRWSCYCAGASAVRRQCDQFVLRLTKAGLATDRRSAHNQ